jgi:hypothetical protein
MVTSIEYTHLKRVMRRAAPAVETFALIRVEGWVNTHRRSRTRGDWKVRGDLSLTRVALYPNPTHALQHAQGAAQPSLCSILE